MSKKNLIKKAFIKSLPVMAAYVVLGMGFGILMDDRGYEPIWAICCSIFIYAGSMQYVGAELLAGFASPVHTAFMTLMVNARHLFYGISMIGKYRKMKKFKPYLIFALTDETYSLLCDSKDYPKEEKDTELYCFLVSLFNQSYWVSGTALGAFLGQILDFNSSGIEFSMTALFVTVFVEQWLSVKEHRAALTGLIITGICLFVFGRENFLIPAMVLITAILSLPYFERRFKRQ
ncbi:MAG: AzlC family ABC transporter permease [Butyrivibrio sp.]|nr:AzlC family ABC transporter permease [Butyrivibrio sp.]